MDDDDDFITSDLLLEDSQEMDSAQDDGTTGHPRSKTAEDWILHINHDLLHAPRSVDDLREHGFADESKSPNFFGMSMKIQERVPSF